MKRYRKQFYVALASIIAVSISIIIYSIHRSQFDATLYIISAPDTLTVSYGDVTQSITSKKPLAIKSGRHSFTFSANGFSSYTVELDISKGETKREVFALSPESDAAREELRNKKYSEVFDGVGSRKTAAVADKITANSPIAEKLPFNTRWYSIKPCAAYRTKTEENGRIGICITTPPSSVGGDKYVDLALKRLEQWGVDKNSYDIKINSSPLATDKEVQDGIAVPCGKDKPSWCYHYPDI